MKLTIGKKLSIGFSILIVFFLVVIGVVYYTLSQIQTVNNRNSNVYVPSMRLLMEFNNRIVESEKLIGTWIFIQSYDDTPDKNRLRELINDDYPVLRAELQQVAANYDDETQQQITDVFRGVDELIITYRFVMDELNDFFSYDDPMVLFEIRPMMEPGGSIVRNTAQITSQLNDLILNIQGVVNTSQVEMQSTLERFRSFSVFFGVLILLSGIIIASVFVRMITRPVISLRNVLNMMGQGKLPEEKIKTSDDEIGDMTKALDFLIQGLKVKAQFATEIGKGNFEHIYEPSSDEDTLGLSLIEMRESLKKAKEEEDKRKVEDTKRNWSTQGVAQFAELLRQNNDNLQELSFSIVKSLVKYLEANQGGVFILNDEDQDAYVELSACYAYERRKFMQKKIMKGEGLVGTCLQEGETIFLTEVPNSYISITSGLGDSNPRCILIVPLKLNDQIFGVIEIASFRIMEPYQIEFVEKVAESIASTISTVKINIRTTELLHQSQEQSEEMRAQEEEMRQNMEEMHATQEEMERKEIESQGFFDAMNATIPFAEISVDGKIKKFNTVFCQLTQYTEFDAEATSFFKLFDKAHLEAQGMADITYTISEGTPITGDFKLTRPNGSPMMVKGGFKPIMNKYGAPTKILFVISEVL